MRHILLLGAFLFLVTGNEASAHAFLLKSDPAVGATVAAPKAIRLEFSEAVELSLSGVEVVTGSRVVAISAAHFNGNDHKILLIDLPSLQPGAYRLKWHVVSVDSHRTEGDFAFQVKS